MQSDPATGDDIWVLTIHDGQITTNPWLKTRFQERFPDWSPDGRWLAYTSNESGRDEVYVQPYPGPGPRHLVSRDGGNSPVWSHDGREIFYAAPAAVTTPGGATQVAMMAAPVTLGASVSVGTPRKLFEGAFLLSSRGRGYDVTADGRRFVMVQPREQASLPATEIVIVENWFEELKRLVPTN